jgi:hypothetical protein
VASKSATGLQLAIGSTTLEAHQIGHFFLLVAPGDTHACGVAVVVVKVNDVCTVAKALKVLFQPLIVCARVADTRKLPARHRFVDGLRARSNHSRISRRLVRSHDRQRVFGCIICASQSTIHSLSTETSLKELFNHALKQANDDLCEPCRVLSHEHVPASARMVAQRVAGAKRSLSEPVAADVLRRCQCRWVLRARAGWHLCLPAPARQTVAHDV